MSYVPASELRVLKAAEELADGIWENMIQWQTFARDTVGKQLVGAANSVGAKIAESHGRHHLRNSVNSLYFGKGLLEEAKYWLRRVRKRALLKRRNRSRTVSRGKRNRPGLAGKHRQHAPKASSRHNRTSKQSNNRTI
jgi:four helix bundle protein